MTAAQLQVAITAAKDPKPDKPAQPGKPAPRRKLAPRLPKSLQQELARKAQKDL